MGVWVGQEGEDDLQETLHTYTSHHLNGIENYLEMFNDKYKDVAVFPREEDNYLI